MVFRSQCVVVTFGRSRHLPRLANVDELLRALLAARRTTSPRETMKKSARSRAHGASPLMGDAIDFLRLLWAVDHDLRQKSIAMQGTIGVTGPQRLVLRIVGRFPGISLGSLAAHLGAHPSTATGLTKRLVKRGLVRASKDPEDGRRFQLRLTPRGRALESRTGGTIEQSVQHLLASTTAPQVAAARAVLERFRRILSEGDVTDQAPARR